MAKMGIILDGNLYRVWIVYDTLDREFAFVEGNNEGESINGTDILDTLGTKYSYSMRVVPDLANLSDYDDFYYAISNPERVHSVTMPFGQSTIDFDCKIESGKDRFKGNDGSRKLWTGLNVKFIPIAPQRTV